MMIIKENKKIELDIFTLNLYNKKNSEKNMHQFLISNNSYYVHYEDLYKQIFIYIFSKIK